MHGHRINAWVYTKLNSWKLVFYTGMKTDLFWCDFFLFSVFSLCFFWSGDKTRETATGEEVIVQWEKMSKSKYNGVDPQVRSLIYVFFSLLNFYILVYWKWTAHKIMKQAIYSSREKLFWRNGPFRTVL